MECAKCKSTKFKKTEDGSEIIHKSNCLFETVFEKIEKAEQRVTDLCEGKVDWTMRVPADEEKDSDLIITAALCSAKTRIEELEDFCIWLTGCGYDFTQHPYFCEQRDKLLK